jgi:hypothetical protein
VNGLKGRCSTTELRPYVVNKSVNCGRVRCILVQRCPRFVPVSEELPEPAASFGEIIFGDDIVAIENTSRLVTCDFTLYSAAHQRPNRCTPKIVVNQSAIHHLTLGLEPRRSFRGEPKRVSPEAVSKTGSNLPSPSFTQRDCQAFLNPPILTAWPRLSKRKQSSGKLPTRSACRSTR